MRELARSTIEKIKIQASGPINSANRGEKVKVVTDFLFLAPKSLRMSGCSHEIGRRLFLDREV